jgi:hypothetical protein
VDRWGEAVRPTRFDSFKNPGFYQVKATFYLSLFYRKPPCLTTFSAAFLSLLFGSSENKKPTEWSPWVSCLDRFWGWDCGEPNQYQNGSLIGGTTL